MLGELRDAGYEGPISLRVNPGFGHGHVNACDTGGPSSKHGIWFSDVGDAAIRAERFGMSVTMLHAHIGSGPKFPELLDNMRRLAKEFVEFIPQFPKLMAISLGGGIPHNYRNSNDQPLLEPLREVLEEARASFCSAAERDIRLEIEPGRYLVAPAVTLVARVTDVKRTEENERGKGQTFVMVDAGFHGPCPACDVRVIPSHHYRRAARARWNGGRGGGGAVVRVGRHIYARWT